MNARINSYDDLLREEERLRVLLALQREELVTSIKEVGQNLRPVAKGMGFIGKFLSKDKHNPLLNIGVDSLVNLVVKKVLLRKAGWMKRLIIPFLVRNVSSHLVADNKREWTSKLWSWITGNKHKNGHPSATAEEYKDTANN